MHDILRDDHPGPADPLNPAFNEWLNRGAHLLMPQAQRARNEHDYQLVLRDYANGFADGHVNIAMTDTEPHLWPGFLVRTDGLTARLRVSVLADAAGAPKGLAAGDELLGCGNVSASQMLRDRVLAPLLNRNVPQRLGLKSAWLMVADADDEAAQTPSCVFKIGSEQKVIGLKWQPIDAASLAQDLQKSAAIDIPPIGVRRIDDVWLISMPTFDPQADEVAQMQGLIAFVQTHAAMLHAARHVVIDLRGNDGGSDAWGDASVNAVENSVSLRVEWRVSARNEAALRLNAATAKADGQADIASYYADLAARMDLAVRRRQVFMEEDDPASAQLPHIHNEFAHPVYLLTTPYCASACLDVIDVANDLPGIVRVGLETSSDTDYLDTASAALPSGHAVLHYAMKVFRGRPRLANASYKPQITWPGGAMTDAAIARWIDTLP
jgi:hypothetical protein